MRYDILRRRLKKNLPWDKLDIWPLESRPYGALQICLLLLLLLLFFDLGTQFPRKEKITLCNIKKYKNQAGMNLTPPPPSSLLLLKI